MFLYDPCVDEKELEVFKKLAFSCLRMHIITPYKNLPSNELFSVVTYGNRLALNKVIGKEQEIIQFLRVTIYFLNSLQYYTT